MPHVECWLLNIPLLCFVFCGVSGFKLFKKILGTRRKLAAPPGSVVVTCGVDDAAPPQTFCLHCVHSDLLHKPTSTMMPLLRTAASSTKLFAHRSSGCKATISAFQQQQQQRAQSTLVVAEPTDGSALSPSTLSAITAASKLHSGPISLLTFSSGNVGVPSSVSSVIQASAVGNSSLLAETITDAVVTAHKKYGYSHIVASATKFGANYIGRAGAQLGVSPISDVVEVLSDGTSECT